MGDINSCQRLKSNTGDIMGTLDTFYMPDAEDGVCKHCDKYNSELDREGYSRREDTGDGLDCWRERVVQALIEGKAKRLADGTLVFGTEEFYQSL